MHESPLLYMRQRQNHYFKSFFGEGFTILIRYKPLAMKTLNKDSKKNSKHQVILPNPEKAVFDLQNENDETSNIKKQNSRKNFIGEPIKINLSGVHPNIPQ